MTEFIQQVTPLEWGKKAVESVMASYQPADMPPANRWHYHQGVFLCGVHRLWEIERNSAYVNYIKDYVDHLIDENGSFLFRRDELDAIQAGLLLFPLYEQTGDSRYREAARKIRNILRTINRNSYGGFWHKDKYPNQMWLDGLYMAGPFAIQYGMAFNEPELTDMVMQQEQLMQMYTKDEQTGLYRHAWDASKKVNVCDPLTGQTTEVWGRALGWYAMTLIDFIDLLGNEHDRYDSLVTTFRALMTRLLHYQDEANHLWYQIVDKGYLSDNWIESSCSSLFIYALAKGHRLGLLTDQAYKQAEKGFDALIKNFVHEKEDGHVEISGICIGTSIGLYEDYINRPTSINDLHGVGAFALACAELEKAKARG